MIGKTCRASTHLTRGEGPARERGGRCWGGQERKPTRPPTCPLFRSVVSLPALALILAFSLVGCHGTDLTAEGAGLSEGSIVLSGFLPSDPGGEWELGWYRDESYPSGPCVVVAYQTTSIAGSRSVCPTESVTDLFAVRTFDDVGGDLILGYLPKPDSILESGDPAPILLSQPIEALDDGRLFIQFIQSGREDVVLHVNGSEVLLESIGNNP